MKKVAIPTLFILALLLIGFVFQIVFQQSDPRSELADFYHDEYFKLVENQPADPDLKAAGNPEMAALQDYNMVVNPFTKTVPRESLLTAYHYAVDLANDIRKSGRADDLDWSIVSSNMGGRTKALMWDPNDADHKKVWAGGVTGGLWYNEDITSNGEWVAVNDFWPSLSVHDICFDPNNTQIFYVGTGEYETSRVIYRESSAVGIGIWKTTDGGQTWDLLPATAGFEYISDLMIRDEAGISVIYAGVVSGTYHGINHQSEPSDGLYRSVDGGENWQQVLPDIEGFNVPFAPADIELTVDGRIFIGTMKNLEGEGGATILYSDLGTSGSWTVFNDYEEIIETTGGNYNVPGRVRVVSAPSDANVVYVLVGAGYYASSTGFNYAKGGYILRSDDAGQNWIEKNQPGGNRDWASLSWHAFIASVNPENPDELYVGGLDVWKSSNGGNSWNHLSDWSLMYYGGGDEYVHADQHNQVYRPGTDDEMIFGSDGGVFYTNNSTSSDVVFQEKNNNYSTLQFYTCDIYPVPGVDIFVGGLQDNGTLIYSGQPLDINDMVTGGDGAYAFFDDNDEEVMITSVYYNAYYSFQNFNWYDYLDAGSGIFINPADLDNNNDILYANGVEFSGSNANKILRVVGTPGLSNYSHISVGTGINVYFSALKVSPYSPAGTSTLFLGSQTGHLFKVTGAESTPVTENIGSNDFPAAYVSSVAVGGSEDTLCVTFSNYGVSKVWQTYNGGETWNDITGNLPDMPVRWALYHPSNAKQIMLATEMGIWKTDVGHQPDFEWQVDNGFPFVRVDMLQVRPADDRVLAASHGRGLIHAEWPYVPTTQIPDHATKALAMYPNPGNGLVYFSEPYRGTVSVYSLTGDLLYTEDLKEARQLDLRNLSSGVYFVKLQGKEGTLTERLVIR